MTTDHTDNIGPTLEACPRCGATTEAGQWNSRVSVAGAAPMVDDLKLSKDEIGELINYNLKRLSNAPCDEMARAFRKRITRLRRTYET